MGTMHWLVIFAALSVILSIAGGPPYLFDILRHKTKPERATWFVWSLQGSIAFGSQALLGASWSLFFVGLNAAGNVLVFLLSLKFGVGGWRLIDKLALVVAMVGLAVSLIFKQPVIALGGVILADFAGSVPTFLKVYHMPDTETTFMWMSFASASVFAALSVGAWKWSLLAYPLYLAADNYAIVVFQMLGRLAIKRNSSKQHR